MTGTNYTNYTYFAGKAAAQRAAEARRHGNESRYRRKTEGYDVPQDLYSETRKRQVCVIDGERTGGSRQRYL